MAQVWLLLIRHESPEGLSHYSYSMNQPTYTPLQQLQHYLLMTLQFW